MRELTPEDPALAAAELMLACVQYGPEAIDWEAEAIRDLEAVYDAGRSLHIGATHPSCERAVWRAIIEHDVPNSFRKFSAVIGLMSLQIAMDDVDGLRGLIDWVSASAPHWADNIRDFLMLADLAGLSVGGDAAERAEDIRRSLPGLLEGQWDTELWFLGVWSAYRGNVDQARELRDTLGAWAKDGHRRTVLLATSLDAHVAIVDGDTARAVALLDGLRPNGPRPDLTWYPWEGLGLEWLTLAKIELARGNHAKAFDVASWLDAPGSVPNLMYMRESLAVRADAARQLERNDRVALLERRMDRLRGR